MVDLEAAAKALDEGDLPALCGELYLGFRRRFPKKRLRALIDYALTEAPPPVAADGPEQFFLDSIGKTKRLLRGETHQGAPRIFAGADLDFISDQEGLAGWSPVQYLNYLLLGKIQPTRKAVVVSSMRDDGIYILEWIAHYLSLGFDHIILYTNDNSDGSEELLCLLASHGIITLVESEITGTVPPEGKAYGHAIHLLHELRDFEWAMFVDSDEYFVPSNTYKQSVVKVLAAVDRRFPERPPAGICYDWMWYISGMKFARTAELLVERFQHARPHHLTKSLARIQDIVSMRLDHHPEPREGGLLVDSTFEPIDMESIFWRIPQYKGGQVNHYWCRSFEEFAVKKFRGASLKLEVNQYDRPFSNFFSWNQYETAKNHRPMNAALLQKVKHKIEELKALEGVAPLADALDANFPALVKRVTNNANLLEVYKASETEQEDF